MPRAGSTARNFPARNPLKNRSLLCHPAPGKCNSSLPPVNESFSSENWLTYLCQRLSDSPQIAGRGPKKFIRKHATKLEQPGLHPVLWSPSSQGLRGCFDPKSLAVESRVLIQRRHFLRGAPC